MEVKRVEKGKRKRGRKDISAQEEVLRKECGYGTDGRGQRKDSRAKDTCSQACTCTHTKDRRVKAKEYNHFILRNKDLGERKKCN